MEHLVATVNGSPIDNKALNAAMYDYLYDNRWNPSMKDGNGNLRY